MTAKIKGLCVLLVTISFCAFVTGGCGGGGGDSASNNDNDNMGWYNDPYSYYHDKPKEDNQPTPDIPANPENDNPNNPPDTDNQNNDSPVVINGTWEIVSGYGTASLSTMGDLDVKHYTYVPGKIGPIGVEVSRNTWGGTYEGAYCVTLTGKDLASESTYKGTGIMILYCTVDEIPQQEAIPVMVFAGGLTFDYIGDGTYQDTDETSAKYTGITQRVMPYTSTLKLEDAQTLRWTYWSKTEMTNLASEEIQQEIVLKKVQ